jgi:hypothetical protein
MMKNTVLFAVVLALCGACQAMADVDLLTLGAVSK